MRFSKNSIGTYFAGLTNYIIHQRKVGSVVTQSYNDYSDDEDDDANPNGLPSAAEISKEVYGLATVIKLLREKSLIKGVIEYLVQVREMLFGCICLKSAKPRNGETMEDNVQFHRLPQRTRATSPS